MLKFFGITDRGLRRANNQDGFFAGFINNDSALLAVCDGMGGANGGETASTMCLEVFTKALTNQLEEGVSQTDAIKNALWQANNAVYNAAQNNESLSGMGTTLVAALVQEDCVYFASVGDSRIYIGKEASLCQMTHDHSYVQTLVDNGQITSEQAKTHPNRNIITKAVGTSEEVEADMFVMQRGELDTILLCSDGLCGYVDEDKFKSVICSNGFVQDKVRECLELSLDEGAPDNVTVIVCSFNEK